MAATTDIIQAFKYRYGKDDLQYFANEEVVMWNFIKRKMVHIGGRGQYIIPIQKQNGGVLVGSSEGGAKTTRNADPATTEATFALQEFNGKYSLTYKMIQDSAKSEDAFARGLDFMKMSYKRRTLRYLNAELLGTGLGELGIFASAQDTTTPVCRALPLVDMGMIVDVISSADNYTKLAAARQVTDIDATTRTVTLSGAAIAGSAAGDYLTAADSMTPTKSQHMYGVRAWINTANPAPTVTGGFLGGIDRSAAGNSFWKSTVLSNGGVLRSLTEDLLITAADNVRERGGVAITDYMANNAIMRRYHELIRADTFFALQSVGKLGSKVGIGRSEDAIKSGKNSMGETPYQFSDTPWRSEQFMDANKLLGINRDSFSIGYSESELPEPTSEAFGDENIPFFTRTANTSFDVEHYWQGQLICDNPMANLMVSDIAES